MNNVRTADAIANALSSQFGPDRQFNWERTAFLIYYRFISLVIPKITDKVDKKFFFFGREFFAFFYDF